MSPTRVLDALELLRQRRRQRDVWTARSALDPKTEALVMLAVLAVLRRLDRIPDRVRRAKTAGATRAEVITAILVARPIAGKNVLYALPAAMQAYDVIDEL